MDPVVSLSPTRVDVAPGAQARVEVTVRNPADIVVEYDVVVLGPSARWTDVQPATLSLMPPSGGVERTEATVELTFRPPRPPAAPAGEVPFGVRCVSRENPDWCTVEEGLVVVAAVRGLEADLRPVGRRGRRSGHVGLVLRNTGTMPVEVSVRARDQAERLRFAVGPDRVTVPAGETATAYIAVKPRDTIWLGRAVEHPFVVTYRAAGGDGADTRTGVYEQRAAIPRWLLVVAALVVLALALVVVWLFWRAPADPVEVVRGGAPPPVVGVAVDAAAPGTAVVSWTPSPYAVSGYRVRVVDEAGVPSDNRVLDDPQQGSFEWVDLAGGATCFEVVAIGYDDQDGTPQGRPCVDVEPPVDPSDEASGDPSAEGSGDPSAEGSGDPTADGSGEASAEGSGEPTLAPTPPDATGAPGGEGDLREWFVVYRSTPVGDIVARDEELPQLIAALQSAGARAQLVEGENVVRLADDSVHVVEDGFADFAAALQQCEAFRSIAPPCVVGPPPQP